MDRSSKSFDMNPYNHHKDVAHYAAKGYKS